MTKTNRPTRHRSARPPPRLLRCHPVRGPFDDSSGCSWTPACHRCRPVGWYLWLSLGCSYFLPWRYPPLLVVMLVTPSDLVLIPGLFGPVVFVVWLWWSPFRHPSGSHSGPGAPAPNLCPRVLGSFFTGAVLLGPGTRSFPFVHGLL